MFNHCPLAKNIFPLPDKNLEEGDSDEIPMEMPFNANGSPLFSKGQNTLTFKGYAELEGRKCALLNGEIDIAELDVPEELEGDYQCITTGKASYYFDLENGYYIGADIQMTMEVSMDAGSESGGVFGSFVEMKSDNVYKVRLKEIED